MALYKLCIIIIVIIIIIIIIIIILNLLYTRNLYLAICI